MDKKIREFLKKTSRIFTLICAIADIMFFGFMLCKFYLSHKENYSYNTFCLNNSCVQLHNSALFYVLAIAASFVLIFGWMTKSWKFYIPYVVVRLLFTVWFTTQSLHQAFQKGFTFTMVILLIALILHLLLVSIAITAVIFDAKSVRKLERKAKPPTSNSQNVQWKQFPDDIYHFPVLDLRNYRVIRDDNTDRALGGNALPDRPQIGCSVRRKSMAEAPTSGPKTVCLNMKTDADEDVLQWMDAAEGLPTVHDHYSIDETSPAPPSSSKPSTSLTPSSNSKRKQSTSCGLEEKRPNHSLIISISPGTCPDILTGTTASTDDETDDDDDYVDIVDFRKPDDEQSPKTKHNEVNIDVEKLEQEILDIGEDLVRRNSEYGIERTTC